MFGIGKKTAQQQESNESVITVDQVHKDFYSQMDQLINSNFDDTPQPEDLQKYERGQRLIKLGFESTAESKYTREEENKLIQLGLTHAKRKKAQEAARYFSQKYPLLKMLTYDQFNALCEKYKLFSSSVKYYTGDIPERNLIMIEQTTFDKKDIDYMMNDRWKQTDDHYDIEYMERVKESFTHDTHIIYETNTGVRIRMEERPLMIAAPSDMFDHTKLNAYDRSIMPVVKDPIVVKPVLYKKRPYLLIITAWGEEASDPDVVNHKFN